MLGWKKYKIKELLSKYNCWWGQNDSCFIIIQISYINYIVTMCINKIHNPIHTTGRNHKCPLGGLMSIRKMIYYWFCKCDCLHKVLWYILRTFYFVDYAVYLHSIDAPKMERLVSKTLNNDRIIGYNTVKYQ